MGQREMEILELNSHITRAAERWTRSRRSGTSGQRRSGTRSTPESLKVGLDQRQRELDDPTTPGMEKYKGLSWVVDGDNALSPCWNYLEWSSGEKGAGVHFRVV